MSWTLIEHQALTSSVASVTLGSGGTIPQTYKTLKLVVSSRTNGAYAVVALQVYLNGVNTSYTGRFLSGNGSSASSSTYATYGGVTPGANATSSTFGNTEITIPNYAGSTNKPYSSDSVTENNATEANQVLVAGLRSVTDAVTSIKLDTNGGDFVSGSTFTLYGLA